MLRKDEWPNEAETMRWRIGVAEAYYQLLKEYAQQTPGADHKLMAAKIEMAEHDLYVAAKRYNALQ